MPSDWQPFKNVAPRLLWVHRTVNNEHLNPIFLTLGTIMINIGNDPFCFFTIIMA